MRLFQALVLGFLLSAGAISSPTVQAADPTPLSFGMATATLDSIADGTRHTMDMALQLDFGLHSMAHHPGYTSVWSTGLDGQGHFEDLRMEVSHPAVALLASLNTPVRAQLTVVKQTDPVGLAYLLLEDLHLVAYHSRGSGAFDGALVIALGSPIRVTHKADGTPYPEPVILKPHPLGLVMVDEAGKVQSGVTLPKGGSRTVEVQVEGQWVPIELRGAGW